ncbi:hypothetical protein SNE26_10210 [Mucilaginibacter sp. cycad4]|uniref:hypothetical protein n=1 Tax=Mucilaginibacter sp. cycad4 TaxID=3342096 RepID=UPI002AAA942B|nr:hypothetical protein [Mucilaginibacter gossypii]WPV02148.1 hypothetical protein SNE26_10210 [Mucilaginibacter gossypii]
MKTTVKIMAVCLLTVSACHNATKGKQNFIPGTYVDSTQTEYGKAMDTLVIKHLDGPNYQIDSRATKQAIRDGKVLPAHHESNKRGATWDTQKEQLIEIVSGRVYTFQPYKHTMMLNNNRVLQKIN